MHGQVQYGLVNTKSLGDIFYDTVIITVPQSGCYPGMLKWHP